MDQADTLSIEKVGTNLLLDQLEQYTDRRDADNQEQSILTATLNKDSRMSIREKVEQLKAIEEKVGAQEMS